MYILSKFKDYYDHFSYIYGVDKKVVFDRRGSKRITDKSLISYQAHTRHLDNFIVLETGCTQYLMRVTNIVLKNDVFISCDVVLEKTYRDNIHYGSSPITIFDVGLEYRWSYNDWKNNKRRYVITDVFRDTIKGMTTMIDLPILAETSLTKLIDPDVVWKDVQNYISSLNNDKDIDVDLKMSDKEKAGVHGFDKYSFRNPIK